LFSIKKEPLQQKYILVAEEDNGIFILANTQYSAEYYSVLATPSVGPMYWSSLTVTVELRTEQRYMMGTRVVPSCSALSEFDVDAPWPQVATCPFSLDERKIKELHLRIRIHHKT
jgi:hypothetical protein